MSPAIKDIFTPRLGHVKFTGDYLTLDFEQPYKYRGNWRAGDSIARELVLNGEMISFIKKFNIKRFPFEIFDTFVLENVIDELRK